MTKTTAELRTMKIGELRAEAATMNERLAADSNDAVAAYALNRIEAEVIRRQRMCRAEHLIAGRGICALLSGHAGPHRSLAGDRW